MRSSTPWNDLPATDTPVSDRVTPEPGWHRHVIAVGDLSAHVSHITAAAYTTWRSPPMPLHENPIHTPVSCQGGLVRIAPGAKARVAAGKSANSLVSCALLEVNETYPVFPAMAGLSTRYATEDRFFCQLNWPPDSGRISLEMRAENRLTTGRVRPAVWRGRTGDGRAAWRDTENAGGGCGARAASVPAPLRQPARAASPGQTGGL